MGEIEEQSIKLTLTDEAQDCYEQRPIIRETGHYLTDMPGYWEKMKKQADFLMAQTVAYWDFFKKKDDSKIDKNDDEYAVSDLERDFYVIAKKRIDEDKKEIVYHLTGIPNLGQPEMRDKKDSIQIWRNAINFLIDKGKHIEFKAAQLYQTPEEEAYDGSPAEYGRASIILQIFVSHDTS